MFWKYRMTASMDSRRAAVAAAKTMMFFGSERRVYLVLKRIVDSIRFRISDNIILKRLNLNDSVVSTHCYSWRYAGRR
jgi:hypothetical protein